MGTEVRGKGVPESRELYGWVRVLAALGCAGAWMVVSSMLTLVNKFIMVDIAFHHPLTVSTLGMFGSSALSYLCCKIFRIVPLESPGGVEFSFWISKMLPIGLCMALTLWFGNMVYMYLTVAFIQILKAFVPIMVMILLFMTGLETPSLRLIWSVLLLTGGTAIASYGEVNMSFFGLFIMFLAELFEAARMVMTQHILVGLKFHPIEGLMYLAPACCAWTFAGVFFVELPTILRNGDLAIIIKHPLMFSLSMMTGFAVNGLAYYTIKLASSLTLKVLATVKNALLVGIGMLFLQEVVTKLQLVGYAISLIGFAWYQKIKLSQIATERPGNANSAHEVQDSVPEQQALLPANKSPRMPA